jgi:hypothetical protein
MNLSFDRKVMLGVRVIYRYSIATSTFPLNIILGLYVLNTALTNPTYLLQNTLLVKFYTESIFKALHISSVHL